MNGMATYDHPDAILKGIVSDRVGGFCRLCNSLDLGFDWSSLPPSSTVVDVGGGLGHLAMRIYQEHPTLKFIIQDRPVVIAQAQEVSNANNSQNGMAFHFTHLVLENEMP